MENKKIKFPIAAILFSIGTIYSIISFCVLVNKKYYNGLGIVINIVTILIYIFMCISLIQRKTNMQLFIATLTLFIPKLYNVIFSFNLHSIINLLILIAILFIVATVTLPSFLPFQNVAKKVYFIPAIAYVIYEIVLFICRVVKDYNYYDGYGHYYITDNIPLFLTSLYAVIALFTFLNWCVNPYKKTSKFSNNGNMQQTYMNNQNNYNGDVYMNSNQNTLLDYNEANIDLVKHILYCKKL